MRYILFLLVVFTINSEMKACDQCSVVLGSGAISEGHFIGCRLKYRRQFRTVASAKSLGLSKHLEHFSAEGEIKEIYTGHEVFGNYQLGRNWHVMASIPLVNNYRSVNGTTLYDIYGLGDPWLMLRKQKSWKSEDDHFFIAGGVGVKLPLGSTSRLVDDVELDLDMQPGTGSMDYLANLVLLYEYKSVFLMSQNTAKWNGMSPNEFKYGNNLSSSLVFGKRIVDKEDGDWRLSLTAGSYLEVIGKDEVDGLRTGDVSYTYYFDGGVILRHNRLIATVNGQMPFSTAVDSRQLPTTHRFIASLQYEI